MNTLQREIIRDALIVLAVVVGISILIYCDNHHGACARYY
jgi:preprotein translocase subunit SecE